MASIEQRGNRFRIIFRYAGKRYAGALKTTKRREAEALVGVVDRALQHLEQGVLDLPPDTDLLTFVLSGGKRTDKPRPAPTPIVTFGELRDRYLRAHGNGALEDNSLATIQMHLRHFEETLAADFPMPKLALEHLQQHLDRRAKEKGHHGRPISAVTLRKEVASLRACWNWGVAANYLSGRFPNRGLRYPKLDEKEPFQTCEEIRRKIARGGLTPAQEKALWDCAFLTLAEIDELLCFVQGSARHGFLYPMFAFACHTGARRSEMLRTQIDDIDFEGETVLLREKKRSKEKRTHRRVPLSPFLLRVLRAWVANHPGGQHLFCHEQEVARSKKRRLGPAPLTRNEANDHFRRTVEASKWDKLRGWHVFRHSFVSNCAARGVDQRMIDEWVGHQSEEMRRRYRHLIPNQQRQAICLVFGER
jgi:integrase